MSISDLKSGQSATIYEIPQEDLRAQLLRFGIISGSRVCCSTNIPFGPVVLKFGGQEIAFGRQLARQITVNS